MCACVCTLSRIFIQVFKLFISSSISSFDSDTLHHFVSLVTYLLQPHAGSELQIIPFWQIEMDEKRKAEGKKARDDKDKVMEMLFAAFENHQYYNIKDLQKLTRQPIVCIFAVLLFTEEHLGLCVFFLTYT